MPVNGIITPKGDLFFGVYASGRLMAALPVIQQFSEYIWAMQIVYSESEVVEDEEKGMARTREGRSIHSGLSHDIHHDAGGEPLGRADHRLRG